MAFGGDNGELREEFLRPGAGGDEGGAVGGERVERGVPVDRDTGAMACGFQSVEQWEDLHLRRGATEERAVVAGGERRKKGGNIFRGECFHDGMAGGEIGPVGICGDALFVGAGGGLRGVEEFHAADAAERN